MRRGNLKYYSPGGRSSGELQLNLMQECVSKISLLISGLGVTGNVFESDYTLSYRPGRKVFVLEHFKNPISKRGSEIEVSSEQGGDRNVKMEMPKGGDKTRVDSKYKGRAYVGEITLSSDVTNQIHELLIFYMESILQEVMLMFVDSGSVERGWQELHDRNLRMLKSVRIKWFEEIIGLYQAFQHKTYRGLWHHFIWWLWISESVLPGSTVHNGRVSMF